jgi:hypothetical protein
MAGSYPGVTFPQGVHAYQRHLCLRECPYPHRCPACGVCVETPGPCRECRAARQLLPPRPLGRGLDALRKEVGLDG